MRIVFRVDSSTRMGSGHLMRCLALAGELRTRGVEVLFVSRAHAGNFAERVTGEGFALALLQAPAAEPKRDNDYASWLGVPEGQDADETIAALGGAAFDLLVVDHYGLGHEFESALRPHVRWILAIDDLASRRHDCDLLLDQNHAGAAGPLRYAGLVSGGCRQLLGPRFALLRPEYAQLRAHLPPRSGAVKRILIFFGASDQTGALRHVLAALASPGFAHLAVDVVTGAAAGERDRVLTALRGRPGTTVHSDLPTLAGLMFRADLFIGACGSTTWERACLGLPSLVATIAENQFPAAMALHADGCHVMAGRSTELDAPAWREAIASTLAQPEQLLQIAQRASGLTDGLGTARVAEALLEQPRVGALRTLAGAMPVASTALRVCVLSDSSSWLNPWIQLFAGEWRRQGHDVIHVHSAADIPEGEVCFAIGCSQMIDAAVRARSRHTLVVHESALPQGRGWSPMTWQVIEDRRSITVSLFEAAQSVDAGRIHLQAEVRLRGTELVEEWREAQALATAELCGHWLSRYPGVLEAARPQLGEPTYYPRRGPEHSQLDPRKSIAEQFDLLRTVDNRRYPAWFELRNRRYRLAITAADDGVP